MTVTITSTNPTPTEAAGVAAFAGAFTVAGAGGEASAAAGAGTPATVTSGAGTSTIASGAGASTVPAAAAAVNPFPANAALAPFPSPENSTIMLLGGVVSGEPYLRDATGAVWTLEIVGGLGCPFLNGNEVSTAGSGPNITEMLIRGGAVWVQVGTGQWQTFNASMGCFYNGALPPASTGTVAAASSTAAPALPAAPTPSAIAPGSTGVVHTVAATGGQYSTISAAILAAGAGDTISVAPGTYHETPPTITVPLRISSVSPGATIDANGLTSTLARGKAAICPTADCIADWMFGVNVALDQTQSGETAAFRPDVGCGYLTLNDCGASACQTGIGAGGAPCVVVVNRGTYSDCGLPDGKSHNVYISSGATSLTLNNVVVTKPRFAHAIKCRAPQFTMTGGEVDAPEGSPIDLPDGVSTTAVISGVAVNKGAADDNHNVFSVNEESVANGTAGVLFTACTVNAACANPFIQTAGAVVTFDAACKITGNPISANASGGGSVVGLPKAA